MVYDMFVWSLQLNKKITMHKYSYQLSAYYRKEPSSQPSHIHNSQNNYSRNAPYVEMERNKDRREDPRVLLSKTMMTNNTHHPVFNIQNRPNHVKSNTMQLYKPSNTIATLESRLANLTHLSDRHNQALKDLNHQSKRQQSKLYFQQRPSSKSHYQDNDAKLKHDFSFNRIPQYEQQNIITQPIKTQYNAGIRHASTAKTPYSYKAPYEISKQKTNILQKAQLHLNMANLNRTINSKQSTGLKEYNRGEKECNRAPLKIDKSQSRQTYNKLSSLQDRIKSTLQPYSNM